MDYAQMVSGCRRHNSAAWRELYNEFAPMVMGVCSRYASCRDEANDLMQDSFVKVIEKIGLLNNPEKLRSWIYSIAVNTCIQDFRRRYRTVLNDSLDNMCSIEQSLPYGMEEMVEAMSILTPAQRIAVNLRYIEEVDMEEAARQTGCTTSGFRCTLSKGIARMRDYFETKKQKTQ